MTETTKTIYPVITSKLSEILTPENLKSIKSVFKSLKIITKVGIETDIDICDITCQSYEEFMCLHEFRKRYADYKKQISEKAMKKIFH
jgi:hypothetical protein